MFNWINRKNKLIRHQNTIIEVLTKRVEALTTQRVVPPGPLTPTGEKLLLRDRIEFLRNAIEHAIGGPSANSLVKLQRALDIDTESTRDRKAG